MNSFWTLVIGGCLLGAVQLAAGVAIGMWLRRGEQAAGQADRRELLDAGRIAQRLQTLAAEVSISVGAHQEEIKHASEVLAAEAAQDGESLAELVVDVIGGIVRANHNLQSKLETAEHRLEEQAVEIEAHITRSLTDPLTGLPNRREFNDRLEERMAGWNRRGEVFSLVMLDVDHFKRLNDQHGHLAGDVMLTMLGRALRTVLRRDDAVARYGGEEFAMILPGTTLAQAAQVVPKVRDAIARAVVDHGGGKLQVTASGGLATIQPGESSDALIERADAALYAAKSAGRDCAFLHDGTSCQPVDAKLAEQYAENDGAEEQQSSIAEVALSRDAAAEQGLEEDTPDHLPLDEFSEPISPELVQTCDELRQYVRDRGERQSEPALTP